MKTVLTGALLSAAFALSACGGATDETADTAATDAAIGADGTMAGDTGATLTGPGDTTSAAGAGAETGAMMDSPTGASTGAGMEPGAGMDPGAAGDPGSAPTGAGTGAANGGAGQ